MASLSSSARLGNTSASSLIRSSQSIQGEINTYQDSLAAYQYELSPKTDGDLQTYQDYLNTRINNLQTTGTVTDANKALTLSRTLTSATRSNVSANIQRENIDVMAGNGTLQDKYNTIVDQFSRATAIGDMSLAQQLESQAYSVSQTIQYQAQQAATAGAALAKASSSANISGQTSIAGSLDDALKQLNNDISNLGVKDFNKTATAWVNQNRDVLQSLGAVIPQGAQPNYFNLVEGIQAAKYNALVLKSQYQAATDPAAAQNTMRDALLVKNGGTKISTLGGDLTIQQIQQAAQDPSMFAYDYGSGKYVQTAKTGFQYINGQVAPTYSGIVGQDKANQIFFLNPNQTATLTNLGLNFSMNKNGTTGDGVKVQLTQNTPDWLKNILGNNGVSNAYTDRSGNIQFEGPSMSGQGLSYFSLLTVGGLHGVYEHSADGSTHLVGGNYGFDQGAANLLVNAGQQKQQQIQLQTQQEQAALAAQIKIAAPQPLPPLQMSAPALTAPVSATPGAVAPPRTSSISGVSPQSTNILQPAGQVRSNVQGVPLNANPSGAKIAIK
jgi:hypothetical protein